MATSLAERCADARADPDFGSEDLLWGRGGFVFGAAWLRARLGEAALPDERVEPALAGMSTPTGSRRAPTAARRCSTRT